MSGIVAAVSSGLTNDLILGIDEVAVQHELLQAFVGLEQRFTQSQEPWLPLDVCMVKDGKR